MNYTVQPPIEMTDAVGRTTTNHPAFGQISASRVSSNPGAVLYGSDFRHQHYVTLELHASELNRDLARDWAFAKKSLYRVSMTESQWATFVSSMNVGGGVQCTIERTESTSCPSIPFRDESTLFKKEGEAAINSVVPLIEELIRDLEGSEFAGLSATKRQSALSKLQQAKRQIASTLPFVANSFGEHLEVTCNKAKVEIMSWANAFIHRHGLQSIAQQTGGPLSLSAPDEKETLDGQ